MNKILTLFLLTFLFSNSLKAQNPTKTQVTDGLVAFYPFNGNTLDESGNGYHTINYGATLSADRYENPNSSFYFNGIDQYMEIPGTEMLNFESGGFSLCVWVKFTNSTPNKVFIAKHTAYIQSGYFLAVRPSEKVQFYLSGEPGLFTTESYNDGNWHCLVAVYDGSQRYLYIDGLLKELDYKDYNSFNYTNIKFGFIDGGEADHYYEGWLDDIAIYNRSLSNTEVSQLYYNSFFQLNLSAFLEGPFNGSTMNTNLSINEEVPHLQPFSPGPWNYNGNESVTIVPDDVVDWVLVELRETPGSASSPNNSTVIARQAGFIRSNGNITGTDGNLMWFYSNNPVTFNLYALIYHRNHLTVMSANALSYENGVYSGNFYSQASQVYGGALAQTPLGAGKWGMIAADGDSNGQINNTDKNNVWKVQSGQSGYVNGDFDLNGQVNNIDKSNYWSKNGGKSAQLPQSWNCSQVLSISHTTGEVAPVTKTVNYGTVETNLSGTNKCWITQNLGSDHQATSANDATEASAGWYWQFNQKQGYKHDGVNVTPSWNITYIYENSNWQMNNDPCYQTFGVNWRLPTYTEWSNAITNGGWTNQDEAYNSPLKLHAGGAVNTVGILDVRGGFGYFWSNQQSNEFFGWYFTTGGSFALMNDYYKAFGYSVRCIKD